MGNGPAGIMAWAAEIPTSTSSGARTPCSERSSISSTPSKSLSSSSSSAFRPPKLLRSHHRPVPPTLCMTTPCHTLPSPSSRPILTSQQHFASLSLAYSSDAYSTGKTTALSGATDSSLATPSSDQCISVSSLKRPSKQPSILYTIATHVRSWVSVAPPPPASLPSFQSQQSVSECSDTQKFTIVAHTLPSPDFPFSPREGSIAPVWHLSSTIIVDTSSKLKPKLLGKYLPSS